MTCTHVRDLLEALSRFNPDARLEHEVEVDGVSPTTQCTVSVGESDSVQYLTEENNDLDKRCSELVDACEEILKLIQSKDDSAFNSIEEILSDVGITESRL